MDRGVATSVPGNEHGIQTGVGSLPDVRNARAGMGDNSDFLVDEDSRDVQLVGVRGGARCAHQGTCTLHR